MKRYIRSSQTIDQADTLIDFLDKHSVVLTIVEIINDIDTMFQIDSWEKMVDNVEYNLQYYLEHTYDVYIPEELINDPEVAKYIRSEVPKGDYGAINEFLGDW